MTVTICIALPKLGSGIRIAVWFWLLSISGFENYVTSPLAGGGVRARTEVVLFFDWMSLLVVLLGRTS